MTSGSLCLLSLFFVQIAPSAARRRAARSRLRRSLAPGRSSPPPSAGALRSSPSDLPPPDQIHFCAFSRRRLFSRTPLPISPLRRRSPASAALTHAAAALSPRSTTAVLVPAAAALSPRLTTAALASAAPCRRRSLAQLDHRGRPFSRRGMDDVELIEEVDNEGLLEHIEGGESNEEVNVSESQHSNYVKSYEMSKPRIGMTFDTDDEVYNYYNMYAKLAGFSVRKHASHKSATTRKVINRTFVCSKEGHKSMKQGFGKASKQTREVREGCLAHLYVAQKRDGKWEIRKFHDEHSHSLTTFSKVKYLRFQKEFSATSKEAIENLHKFGMGPSRIARALNMSGEPLLTAQGCINHLRTKRKGNFSSECLNVISYFSKKACVDSGFFHRWELDEDGTVMNFFWADGRSRNSYLTFGDVVVFDTTYRTNNLRMPFAPFIGINHHMRSCLFGCALLADETEETFTWLFSTWSECMYGKHPTCIITDQDIAMGNAIRNVFPNTRHIFCTWHIARNAMTHLQDLYARDTFKVEYNKWLYESASIDAFEEGWFYLKRKFDIPDGHWLEGMYNKRSQWISLYFQDLFTAGMHTTQRAESINAFFDGFVNANTSLSDFVQQYDKAIQSHRGVEEQEDFHTMNSNPVYLTHNPLEVKVGKIYTQRVFYKFQQEYSQAFNFYAARIFKDSEKSFYSVYLVGGVDEGKNIVEFSNAEGIFIKCSCKKYEQEGIFCCHIITVLHKKGVGYLPEQYILHRWTINARYSNARSKYLSTPACDDDDVTPLEKLAWQSKVWRIQELGVLSRQYLDFGTPMMDDFVEKFMTFHMAKSTFDVSLPSTSEMPISQENI